MLLGMLGARMRDGEWLALPHLSPRVEELRRALALADRSSLDNPTRRVDALEHVAEVAAELLADFAFVE